MQITQRLEKISVLGSAEGIFYGRRLEFLVWVAKYLGIGDFTPSLKTFLKNVFLVNFNLS